MWTVSLPVTVVNASDNQPSLEARDIIGWLMWVFGIIVEVTADQLKLSFKKSPENKGKWCDVGVWKYSRHPNYFGEVVHACASFSLECIELNCFFQYKSYQCDVDEVDFLVYTEMPCKLIFILQLNFI